MDLERWTKKTGPCTWGHGRAAGPSEVRVGRLGEEEFALWELWLLPERPRRLEEPLGCARQDAGVRRAGGARGRESQRHRTRRLTASPLLPSQSAPAWPSPCCPASIGPLTNGRSPLPLRAASRSPALPGGVPQTRIPCLSPQH